MIKESILRKYANLAVRSGVNIQPGQLLVISSPIHCADFVHLCVEEAYKAGAEEVIVRWIDEHLNRLNALYCDKEVMKQVPSWVVDRKQEEVDRKCAYLSIDSKIPKIMTGTDSKKMQEVNMAQSKALAKFRNYTSANHGQWSVVAIPNPVWAMRVFEQCDEEEAMQKLWDAILKSVYVDEDNDPIAIWKQHCQQIKKHCAVLNQMNFKALHFENSLGTDLTVELVQNHIWAGGSEESTSGVVFNPNMPTEEAFTMPLKTGVNGKVVATKPLSYQGKLIEDFFIVFKEGKAVEFDAKRNGDALENLLTFDEGSCYLGEVALIGDDSPINKSGILFYDTLFDENASCHLALGSAYPMNVKGGTKMSEDELKQAGANISMTHVDFMFGSPDMNIDGILENGEPVPVFRNGNFVI